MTEFFAGDVHELMEKLAYESWGAERPSDRFTGSRLAESRGKAEIIWFDFVSTPPLVGIFDGTE